MRAPGPSEHAIQRAIVAELRWRVPGVVVHHAVNSVAARGEKARVQGGILQGLGVSAGFPDLIVLGQGRIAFLEVKSATGRLRPEQRAFRDFAAENGFPWALVRSPEDAIAAVTAAGFTTRAEARRTRFTAAAGG